jgi:hypothetical protein
MPIENDGQNVDGKPDNQALSNSPLQPARSENVPSPATTQTAAQNESTTVEQLEQDIKSGERWLIGIGVATLLINSIIALIYWGQLKEMRKATDLTHDAVKVASDTLAETQGSNARQAVLSAQAQKDAKAASDANVKESSIALQATIDNFHLDQRPYVGFSDASFVLNKTDPQKLSVVVAVLGKSPAMDVKTQMGAVYWPSSHAIKLEDLLYPPGSTDIQEGTGFPGQRFPLTINGHDPITDNEKAVEDALSAGTHILYIHGRATYTDVFNNAHWTNFCYVLGKDLKSASPCKIHNDTDGEKGKHRK